MAADSLQIQFGDVVRGFRQRTGLSQEALAHEAGVHRTYVSLIERGTGNPTLTVMDALAQALGVPLVDLVSPLKRTGRRSRRG